MIENNVQNLLDSIENLKQRRGIKRDIKIVAATKYATPKEIAVLKKAGICSAGENRVQDFLPKYEAAPDMDWQFIGQLQTNKVKYIVDKVSLIQSVDRLSLAQTIDKECLKRGLIGNILIEVNIANEQSKGGVSVERLGELASQLKEKKNLSVLGLMCIAPVDTKNQKFYLQMAELYDTLNREIFDKNFKFLSMGMSGDYLTAIECGANMIRPGSIIFGR